MRFDRTLIKLPPDITFVIQIVSFLVFWALVRSLFFAPALKALAARGSRTTGAQARAAELTTEADGLTAEAQSKLETARQEGARAAAEIRRKAEAEEQQTLGRFRDEALALLERERAVTKTQVDAARAPLKGDAERLAGEVVARVLGRAA
jgi:F0F1-type ATP synthase membrane subunit b/b'